MRVLSIYKPVSDAEVKALLANNCICDNWGNVEIKQGFDPSSCRNVIFSGKIRLGVFRKKVSDGSGITIKPGILNAHLHNCTVGDNVSIYNIGDCIANYIINDEVVIRNCGKIYIEKTSSFGNGTKVAVLNETGARSVTIWDRLSAHQAYIVALLRHRKSAVRKIEKMTEEYAESVSSSISTIEKNSLINNCTSIRNVKIGPYSILDGALSLNEGTINSCREDPAFVGPGVTMDHFIQSSGSVVSGSAIIDKCFIGQGCVLDKQFSAENSLFFANSIACHGEAVSLFAGPYTVTHHKSTLLIAGLFSFMNAGSGSNQSNHMYKLGPVHQGIVERGCKTASDSYMLWPSHIGPFTVITGKHLKNLDTSSFPFSYIIEGSAGSILVPGINLTSAGTIRDAKKWPQRERRKDPAIIDHIDFDLLNPYTVQKMIKGRDLLKNLLAGSETEPGQFLYNNMKITRRSVERGINLYQKGIDKFLGNVLIKRLRRKKFGKNEELRKILDVDTSDNSDEWIDLAGMIAPEFEVDKLLTQIEKGKIKSLADLAEAFEQIHNSCNEQEWKWAVSKIEKENGISIKQITKSNVIETIQRWKISVTELDDMLCDDARKEFSISSMTGYGVDSGDEKKKLDFKEVRGSFDTDPSVNIIRSHKKEKSEIGNRVIKKLKNK
jgi:hypothetical protein